LVRAESILTQPHADVALTSMHETGALQAIFPEQTRSNAWSSAILPPLHRGRAHADDDPDPGDLRRSKEPTVLPYAELLSELENPAALYFALLFHDVGKGTPGEGHVDASLRVSEPAMERIACRRPSAMVRFLIGRHLALSETRPRATWRIRRLSGPWPKPETVERPEALTLLTYAISAR